MSDQENKKTTAHILPHTHWDREWRYPIWHSRVLLIKFMQQLLRILDNDPEYRCFLLDGQVSPIDDYLAVMPEDREKVSRYIKDGRIAIGPWYTLPDLYPVDAECLVRNLLKGTRVAHGYGKRLNVGYNSFGWGQTAQFPQIYKGFGIDFIVCAKRVGKERAPQSEFIWRGADGTETLTTRLGDHARANFYFHAYLPAKYGVNCLSAEFRYSPERSGAAIHNALPGKRDDDFFVTAPAMAYSAEKLVEGYADALKATDDTACKTERLFLNGTDFSTPQAQLSNMRKDLQNMVSGTDFIHSRLEEYVEALQKNLNTEELKTIEGELRDGPAGDVSGNALSSRIYLKIANKKAQTALLTMAEPLCTALSLLGRPYPAGLFAKAWDYMLKSHPHDSINGVTQDKTANDVEYRLAQAQEIAEALLEDAAADLSRMLNLGACSPNDILLMLYNPHPYEVNTVMQVSVATPAADNIWDFAIHEIDGTPLTVQQVSRDERTYPVHDTEARPWPFATHRHLIWMETGVLPAMGYKAVKVEAKQHFGPNQFYWLPMRREVPGTILTGNHILQNKYLRMQVKPNGTLDITNLQTGKLYAGLHYFEDAGDTGNYWAYYPPYHNKVITSLGCAPRIYNEESGPLSATICVEYTMQLPVSADESVYGVRGKGSRSAETVPVTITSHFTLKKDSKQVEVRTEIDNTVCFHRLRVAFASGIDSKTASAGGHFTVDERPRINQAAADGSYWPEMQTLPMQGFVDVSDTKQGLAITSNSSCEYEYANDEDGTVFITLFRAMNNTIVTWWEAVNQYADQNGSQLQRKMVFNYGIYPHEGNWQHSEIHRQVDALNANTACWQLAGGASGQLASANSFVSISNPNVILSAFKKAEDSKDLVLRLYNPTNIAQRTKVSFGAAVPCAAYLCNLNEDDQSALAFENRELTLELDQNKIVTVLLKL
ncbi:MAG: glycosyl hydrolase-related protein [Treponema sp.]|jgi:mannosylglycerate hydrolase|nr:glycosyl hydrolase-related protein [Treponema sp.]